MLPNIVIIDVVVCSVVYNYCICIAYTTLTLGCVQSIDGSFGLMLSSLVRDHPQMEDQQNRQAPVVDKKKAKLNL